MVTEQCVRKVPVTTCKMVYEERVEQVPYKVCRMVAEQQTIRVPHCVEKQIPVTYTYNVSKLVCFREPMDACGNPIIAVQAEPTPATRPAGADQQPSFGPETKPAEKGLVPVPRLNGPAPQSDVYGTKTT